METPGQVWPKELTAPERFLLRCGDAWLARPLYEHLLTLALDAAGTSGTAFVGDGHARDD